MWYSLSFLLLVLHRSKSSTQVTAVASAQVAEQEAAVAVAAVSDWVYDPNEPRYCLCNQVRKYGFCQAFTVYSFRSGFTGAKMTTLE